MEVDDAAVEGQKFTPTFQAEGRACPLPEAAEGEMAGSRSCPPPGQILPCSANRDTFSETENVTAPV